jgi:16S rRNA (adenine1518-N6/adenine1519-N6)-dimethyltransferase
MTSPASCSASIFWRRHGRQGFARSPAADDRFLEIGPGSGATLRLAPRVSRLTAIEVDRDLVGELAAQLPSNAELVTGDFLHYDLAPLLAAGPLRVAGNLPYNISSPILFKLLRTAGLRDATVMLQREVADRLAARPGTKDYGVLTFTTVKADVQRVPSPPARSVPHPESFRRRQADVQLPVVPAALRPVFDAMVRSMFTNAGDAR